MLYKILSLMEEVTSNLNMEEFKKDHQIFSSFTETAFHKNVTQGKVEGSVKAIKIALQKLNEGCSIEEAKAICGPEIVRQLFTWKKQLKVYLAPFLHGMRYTSFGRHFTKIDELKETLPKNLKCSRTLSPSLNYRNPLRLLEQRYWPVEMLLKGGLGSRYIHHKSHQKKKKKIEGGKRN
ncbi:protein ENHANCED DOWNY MILDEW 2-like isoform X2 [Trifolium pratense]|uniref:protein ENHANCED DOWNY MILDEW 2-like isoform X2 n=1 Tax=Trifolium pratense TaxID=57577 RepID=UPI001E695618|nr:protein ENHANCED DOWNY MILDEW 2-like isoform X2 [Trifolium pratense]